MASSSTPSITLSSLLVLVLPAFTSTGLGLPREFHLINLNIRLEFFGNLMIFLEIGSCRFFEKEKFEMHVVEHAICVGQSDTVVLSGQLNRFLQVFVRFDQVRHQSGACSLLGFLLAFVELEDVVFAAPKQIT